MIETSVQRRIYTCIVINPENNKVLCFQRQKEIEIKDRNDSFFKQAKGFFSFLSMHKNHSENGIEFPLNRIPLTMQEQEEIFKARIKKDAGCDIEKFKDLPFFKCLYDSRATDTSGEVYIYHYEADVYPHIYIAKNAGNTTEKNVYWKDIEDLPDGILFPYDKALAPAIKEYVRVHKRMDSSENE